MAQNWTVTLWGARGAMPIPSPDFLEYGGNTSCVSVDCGEDLVVFDAGSGLEAMALRSGGERPVRLFLSHVHIDHMLGLFTFPLFHDPGAKIHLYGEARDGASFRQQLETLIGPPFWPLGLADFPADVSIHEIGPGQRIALPGGRTVRTLRGSHPNLSLLYRLESAERSMVYTLDCELTETLRPRLVEFCRDAGLLIWDGNFTEEDLALHSGWGHSSWEQGKALRRDAGARLLLLTHYDRSYTDAFLRERERLERDPDVRFGREAMEVRL